MSTDFYLEKGSRECCTVNAIAQLLALHVWEVVRRETVNKGPSVAGMQI